MRVDFLSEENISLHKEYVRQMRLRYSILESSIPSLSGAHVRDLYNLRLTKKDRNDALELLSDITLHDIYFSSFCEQKNVRCETVASAYGSEPAFLNHLFALAKKTKFGFLIVDGNAGAHVVTDFISAFSNTDPVLAIDLCEHAYFMDYQFDRDSYLVNCLSYLDLTKLQQ